MEKPLTALEMREEMPGLNLPVFEWREIPAGAVAIESLEYRVRAFKMSKYPVTYAQYQLFLDASDGYADTRWWNGLPPEDFRRGPAAQQWPIPDHPREHVSWYEAVAFCRWLGHNLNLPISLPTEQQWQRAARGDGERAYPWGERFDDTSLANTREKDWRRTTPVAMHPKGVSPYGLWDMAGNVWEWCLNLYEQPARVDLHRTGPRVLRGGSWFRFREVADTRFRYFALPKTRDFDVGFRLVQTADWNRTMIRPDLILSAMNHARLARVRAAKKLQRFWG